jgi:hypothetical protein
MRDKTFRPRRKHSGNLSFQRRQVVRHC